MGLLTAANGASLFWLYRCSVDFHEAINYGNNKAHAKWRLNQKAKPQEPSFKKATIIGY